MNDEPINVTIDRMSAEKRAEIDAETAKPLKARPPTVRKPGATPQDKRVVAEILNKLRSAATPVVKKVTE